jgi:hypothetical protein
MGIVGRVFLHILFYVVTGYLAIWITLFLHEFSHASFGWLFGVCKSPISIGYLPGFKLPMTPLIDENKIKTLTRNKKILIHAAGLLMNLIMSILISIIYLNNSVLSNGYIHVFVILIIISNFAELESYITFGAIKPISDVKFILQCLNQKNFTIYIPGLILLFIGIYLFCTYILQGNELGYLIYFSVFYITACSSRIILTRPTSKI